VTVNCPSLSRELLERELFGHVKGAFTGAVVDKLGRLPRPRAAAVPRRDGEMPLKSAQAPALLQEREYERVGEAQPRRANVRVIAATTARWPRR